MSPDREDESHYRQVQSQFNRTYRRWAELNRLDPRDPDYIGPEDEPQPPEELE